MRLAKFLLALTLALGCAYSSAHAAELPFPVDKDSTYNPGTPQWRGQAGLTFVQIGASARAEGMGGAFSAVKGDPSAVFYNPAGMAAIEGIGVYVGRVNWFADMTVNHLAVAANAGMFTLGLSYVDMDYGEIPGTVIDDSFPVGYAKTGNIAPQAWALGTFVAVQFTDRFAAGVHPKYIVQDFGANSVAHFALRDGVQMVEYLHYASDNRVGTFAIDLGTQYDTGLRGVTVNMSLANFAQSQRYVEQEFDLPLTYRVGLAAEMIRVLSGFDDPSSKAMLYIDGVDRRDVPLDAAIGVEYSADLSDLADGLLVALRAGRRAARNQDGWLSVGGGLTLPWSGRTLTVDYSYNDYGPDLTATRFGFSLKL